MKKYSNFPQCQTYSLSLAVGAILNTFLDAIGTCLDLLQAVEDQFGVVKHSGLKFDIPELLLPPPRLPIAAYRSSQSLPFEISEQHKE